MSECNHFWRAVDSRRSQCSKCGEITKEPCREAECVDLQSKLAAAEQRVRELESGWVVVASQYCVKPEHEVADAFWQYWRENGETHKHGYYESTWGAINAAIKKSQEPSE